MSIHSSLNTSEKNKKMRSVLKRAERLKILMEKGEWEEGKSIFGLPKIKTARIKIKKEKAAPATAAPAAGATETAPVAEEPPKAKA
ncbi:MAG: small basic protein [Candidatus Omnitrophota bacterium]|nr:MAG: small basic protein [Candidatus Omnitrophota bacterium]